jgi:hypothetical protein
MGVGLEEVTAGLFCHHQAAPEATHTPSTAITRYGFFNDIKGFEQYPKTA